MQVISPAIQMLIQTLRGTEMSWLGDDVEAHLRLGKVRLFKRGVDDDSEVLDNRQRSVLGQRVDLQGKSPISGEDSDDKSQPYEPEEQIDEALKLITGHFRHYIDTVVDSQSILLQTFDLGSAKIVIEDIDGSLRQPSINLLSNAMSNWTSTVQSLRQWLQDYQSDADKS
jgi:hypothetical protein